MRLTEPSVGLSVPICKKALPLPHRMFTNIIDQRAENIKRHFSFLCLAFLSTEWEEVFLVVEQFFFFLCWVLVAVHWLFLVVASGGCSLVAVHVPLIAVASLVAEHRL